MHLQRVSEAWEEYAVIRPAHLSDEAKAWLRSIAWQTFSAVVVGVAQKGVEIAVEEYKRRRAARGASLEHAPAGEESKP